MDAKVVEIKSNRGARCRACDEKIKIKKGERALKITFRPLSSPYVGETNLYYCLSHARAIQIMFSQLDI